MKSTLQVALGILFSISLFTSCSKDKDSKSGEIRIADTTVHLVQGVLINFGESPSSYDGYKYGLELYGEGYDITFKDGDIEWAGSGFAVSFEMYSDSANFLADGVYTFDDELVNPANTFGSGNYIWDLDPAGSTRQASNFRSGTIDVKHIKPGNETYVIRFDLVDWRDNVIEGYYKGPLLYDIFIPWNTGILYEQ